MLPFPFKWLKAYFISSSSVVTLVSHHSIQTEWQYVRFLGVHDYRYSLGRQPCCTAVYHMGVVPGGFSSLCSQMLGIHRVACAFRRVQVGFSRWQPEIANFIFFSSRVKKDVLMRFQNIEAILPLFQGNMIYFLSVVLEEYPDIRYR